MSQVSDALDTLWNKVETDDLKIILPIGDNYLGAIVAGQGDPLVGLEQSKALVANLEAAGITVAKTDIADVATSLKTLMDLEAASLITPPATTTSAPAPAPAAGATS